MSKSRIKVQLPTLATREEAEAAMTELAADVNSQRAIIAQRDAAVLKINESFEGPLSLIAQAIQIKSDALRVWAETNPEQFPKGRKSIEFVSGLLGFRTGTPKLALTSRAWTWERVLEAIKDRAFNFIRTKEEVDKEAILAFAAAGPEPIAEIEAKVLRPIGVKIVQGESFYIEPDLTDTTARQSQEAA